MTVLEEFKQQNPKVWSKPGPGIVIAYALFNNDRENEGLTKGNLEKIPGVSKLEISKGIKYLENTDEITSKRNLIQRKYFLGKKLREEINNFYN
jgi:predicted transcriptional regulator